MRLPKWTRDSGLFDFGDGVFERVAMIVVVIIAIIVIIAVVQAIFFTDSALTGL